jgi:hypothetical protein
VKEEEVTAAAASRKYGDEDNQQGQPALPFLCGRFGAFIIFGHMSPLEDRCEACALSVNV